ncbi:MAG TPA: glycerate kinase, partial [Lactococcus lactis]|nr:glycerate kinase [Lactococcus lactis]
MKKKFVLAPDSFKESLSALEVCQSMEKGIKKVFPEAEIISMPMADGGEGTTDALIDATGG